MPIWPYFPPKYFASNCTYTTSKYCIPNLSNFTFQDSNWPYFTFEDCFIDHFKQLKILCLFSHTLNQKILCLTGRIFHPKIPCLVGHILQRFYVLLGIFHLTNDYHIHQLKCRATAGNGLYTSDTIVEAPVRYNTLFNLAQSGTI